MAQYTFDTLVDFDIANAVLPNEYQKVEYLESTGTQWIDTQYSPIAGTNGCIYSIKFLGIQGFQVQLQCQNGIGGTPYRVNDGLLNNGTILAIGSTNTGLSASYNVWYRIVCNMIQRTYNVNNGLYKGSINFFDGNNVRTSYKYYLFGRCENNFSCGYKYIGRISNFYAKENNTYVTNLISCYRKNDNVAGMYDIIKNQFLINQGVGDDFIVGNDMNYTFQNDDEIIISSTKTHYKYQDGDLVFWYQEIPPLVFKGITFEQTDYWQKPEMVFIGFSFEELFVKKSNNISLFHGMS